MKRFLGILFVITLLLSSCTLAENERKQDNGFKLLRAGNISDETKTSKDLKKGTYNADLLTMIPDFSTAENWLQSNNTRAYFSAMALLDVVTLARKNDDRDIFIVILDTINNLDSYTIEVGGKVEDVNAVIWNEKKQGIMFTFHIRSKKIDYTIYEIQEKKPKLEKAYSVIPKECAEIMEDILTQAGKTLN